MILPFVNLILGIKITLILNRINMVLCQMSSWDRSMLIISSKLMFKSAVAGHWWDIFKVISICKCNWALTFYMDYY